MTFGSLFSGIGGMDLGLERAGMECKWQVEINAFCRSVLGKHWPNVVRFEDIKEIRRIDSVDFIAGGFPCQPFSSAAAGKCRGKEDDRYLWPEMLRIIQISKPSWVLGENVIGLERFALKQVVSDLETIGYEVAPPLEVPACAFGHDHRRSRLWILGYSDSNRKSGRAIHAEASRLSRSDRDSGGMGAEDGISYRMDRLRALGNAVVPQVAEWIGRRIMEAA